MSCLQQVAITGRMMIVTALQTRLRNRLRLCPHPRRTRVPPDVILLRLPHCRSSTHASPSAHRDGPARASVCSLREESTDYSIWTEATRTTIILKHMLSTYDCYLRSGFSLTFAGAGRRLLFSHSTLLHLRALVSCLTTVLLNNNQNASNSLFFWT